MSEKMKVELGDGNAFSILGACSTAMKRAGRYDEWSEFHAEATAGDYDALLRTVMEWFDVALESERFEDDDFDDEDGE
jgi:hypothetical protein